MPILIDVLKRKIIEKIVAGAGDNVGRRVAFSGPPYSLMRELLGAFEGDGGLRLPSGESLPVLMLDKNVKKNPVGFESGACTEAHVIDIRNSDRPYYLLLVPPLQEANLSLETTYVSIGVVGVDEDTASWKWWEQPFVQELVEDLIKAMGSLDLDGNILKLAFEDAAGVASSSGSREHQWGLFEKLFLLAAEGSAWDRLIAMVGLPKCEHGGALAASQVLQVLAGRLNDEGVTRAIEGWVARTELHPVRLTPA
jgi:hypothetical protein